MKNAEHRKIENYYNKKYFILANVYELVINLTPTLTVFLIFILKLLVDTDRDFDTARIYTILSFVGMTYSPTKSLLNTIVLVLDGRDALRRL